MSRVSAVPDEGGHSLRLEAYARYAATLARQEEALAAGDLDLFRELAALRTELQETVAAHPAAGGDAPATPEAREALAEGREHLREAVAREARIRRKLLEMRRDTARSLRELETRESQVKRYAREDTGHPLPSERRRVDIKL